MVTYHSMRAHGRLFTSARVLDRLFLPFLMMLLAGSCFLGLSGLLGFHVYLILTGQVRMR